MKGDEIRITGSDLEDNPSKRVIGIREKIKEEALNINIEVRNVIRKQVHI